MITSINTTKSRNPYIINKENYKKVISGEIITYSDIGKENIDYDSSLIRFQIRDLKRSCLRLNSLAFDKNPFEYCETKFFFDITKEYKKKDYKIAEHIDKMYGIILNNTKDFIDCYFLKTKKVSLENRLNNQKVAYFLYHEFVYKNNINIDVKKGFLHLLCLKGVFPNLKTSSCTNRMFKVVNMGRSLYIAKKYNIPWEALQSISFTFLQNISIQATKNAAFEDSELINNYDFLINYYKSQILDKIEKEIQKINIKEVELKKYIETKTVEKSIKECEVEEEPFEAPKIIKKPVEEAIEEVKTVEEPVEEVKTVEAIENVIKETNVEMENITSIEEELTKLSRDIDIFEETLREINPSLFDEISFEKYDFQNLKKDFPKENYNFLKNSYDILLLNIKKFIEKFYFGYRRTQAALKDKFIISLFFYEKMFRKDIFTISTTNGIIKDFIETTPFPKESYDYQHQHLRTIGNIGRTVYFALKNNIDIDSLLKIKVNKIVEISRSATHSSTLVNPHKMSANQIQNYQEKIIVTQLKNLLDIKELDKNIDKKVNDILNSTIVKTPTDNRLAYRYSTPESETPIVNNPPCNLGDIIDFTKHLKSEYCIPKEQMTLNDITFVKPNITKEKLDHFVQNDLNIIISEKLENCLKTESREKQIYSYLMEQLDKIIKKILENNQEN